MRFKVPAEIAKASIAAGCAKCVTTPMKLLILGFLAGGLSNGTITTAAGEVWKIALPAGIVKFVSGAVFPVGLMLVVIAGAELFTGNCMFAPISVLNKEASFKGLLTNWTLVYIGNLIGSLLLAYFLAYKCGYFNAMPWEGYSCYGGQYQVWPGLHDRVPQGHRLQLAGLPGHMACLERRGHHQQDLRYLFPHNGLRDHRL